jgi:hypothetical protein
MAKTFLDSIDKFCKDAKTPGTNANELMNIIPKTHEQQIDGFQKAIHDMKDGKLSYADMRALYG